MFTIKSKHLNMTADRRHTRMVLDGLGYNRETINRLMNGETHKMNLLDKGTISYLEV